MFFRQATYEQLAELLQQTAQERDNLEALLHLTKELAKQRKETIDLLKERLREFDPTNPAYAATQPQNGQPRDK